MCNLFQQSISIAEIRNLFGSSKLELSPDSQTPNLESGYVGADQDGPVLVNGQTSGTLDFSIKRWGFPAVRPKAKPITNIRNLQSSWWTGINGDYVAKAEYRCLVPFNRFAEWDPANKQNTWFEIDAPQSFFAGVWRPWSGERLAHIEGKKRRERRVMDWELFAFLTTEANNTVAAIHPKAMPVILTTPLECEAWMAGGKESLSLQRPLPDTMMRLYEKP